MTGDSGFVTDAEIQEIERKHQAESQRTEAIKPIITTFVFPQLENFEEQIEGDYWGKLARQRKDQ